MRIFGLPTSITDCPPSPPTVSSQVPGTEVVENVPLSCVPPIRSLRGFCGLYVTLWNWMVDRPAFKLKMRVGIADNHAWQSVRSVPLNPRLLQSLEESVKAPLVRTRPPSEPVKA